MPPVDLHGLVDDLGGQPQAREGVLERRTDGSAQGGRVERVVADVLERDRDGRCDGRSGLGQRAVQVEQDGVR